MLSYRHGFHAGNHADVLKHIVLCLILRSLKKKDKPFCYIDTHAGAGGYSLESDFSNKTGEYHTGIEKVINNTKLKELVPEYFEVLDKLNHEEKKLRYYPGSPYIAASLMREQDSLDLLELHPSDYENLKYNMHFARNAHVHHRDAREGLNALLPPKIKRGLILIDPSYELESDYYDTIKMVKNAWAKFPTAVYAIWYPILGKAIDESWNFTRSLGKVGAPGTLKAELTVKEADPLRGMHGSGMVILNVPWGLDKELKEVLPVLAEGLRQNDNAKYTMNWLSEPK